MTRRWRALVLAALWSLSLAACSKRSAPEALPVQREQPTEAAAETPADLPDAGALALEYPLGLALGRQLRQVESVTITAQDLEEPLFQTQDGVLAQSIYDVLQLQGETDGESAAYTYTVTFSDSQGGERRLELSLDLASQGPAQVREGERAWRLPQADSTWLRNQLRGLA